MAKEYFGPNNDMYSTALTLNTQSRTVVYNCNQHSCDVYQQQAQIEERWPFNIQSSVKVAPQNQERSVAEQSLVYSPEEHSSFGTGDYPKEYITGEFESPSQVSITFHLSKT